MRNVLSIIRGILFNQEKRFFYLRKIGIYDHLDDKTYLSKLYKSKFRKDIKWDNPQSFNEKLQWLKVNDRKQVYTKMVDKYEAKKYVADRIGTEYIIPTLGVWANFDEIDFNSLPDQFVLKCTHDSGGLVICKDKRKLDLKSSRRVLQKAIENNYYLRGGREWPYKNVPHKIIAEEYMADDKQTEGLIDYKFYCFNGTPKFLYVSKGMSNHKTAQIGFLNLEWKLEKFGRSDYLPLKEIPPRPQNFEKMIDIASRLSKNIPFLRVDLYEIKGKIYFGELTFTPCGGLMPFDPPEADYEVGKLLDLEQCNAGINEQ